MIEKKHISPKVIAIIAWLVFLLALLAMTSCNVTKSATKDKTDRDVHSDVTTTSGGDATDKSTVRSETTVLDLGQLDLKQVKIKIEPIDAATQMQVIAAPGDTIRSSNARISYESAQSQQRNNTSTAASFEQYNDIISRQWATIEDLTKTIEQIKEKSSEKTEKTDSTSVLYIVLAAMAVLMLAVFLSYKHINRQTKAIEAVLNRL